MRIVDKRRQVNRRTFLRNGSAVTFGAAFVATTAWLPQIYMKRPFPRWGADTGRTLTRVARDVYPHDRLADEYYLGYQPIDR
jgi:hypothetical protein